MLQPPGIKKAQGFTRNVKGFTLLEVLVASAILSMVLAILYGVFSRTLTSKQIAEEQSAQSRAARIVLLRLSDDLQASFPFSAEDPRFVGQTSQTTPLPEASLSFISMGGFSLTSGGHEGDWYEIEYELIPDPYSPSTRQLVRRTRVAPTTPNTTESRRQEGETLPLLTDVQGLRLRFFDGRAWHDEWGKVQTRAQLPRAVEVKLYLASKTETTRHEDTKVVTFSTLVDLPLAGEVISPGGGKT
jgi:general secretion pathway protein J